MKKLLLLLVMLLTAAAARSQIEVYPDHIDGLNYEGHGPSNHQSYQLTGNNLSGNTVTVTAPANFELATDPADFLDSLSLNVVEGSILDQPIFIYVRLKADLSDGEYSGKITHSAGVLNPTTVYVDVAGTVRNDVPSVLLDNIDGITPTGATVHGIITDNGGNEITAHGVCWSISTNPTTDDSNITIEGGAINEPFSFDLTNLTPETTYHVRVFATNEMGVSYSEEEFIFATPALPTYNVNVKSHGEGIVSVSPTIAHENDTISITISETEMYELESLSVYNTTDPSQTIVVSEQLIFIMPNYDVTVSAMFRHKSPEVGDITEPDPICASESLDLTEPSYYYANSTEWQLSKSETFDTYIIYNGQPLDTGYDGWWIRFKASNIIDTKYSNSVRITVHGMNNLKLEGEENALIQQQVEYRITGAANITCSWIVSDAQASINYGQEADCEIIWQTVGLQQVTVIVTDIIFGCTDTLSMNVTVEACINEDDIHDIVYKRNTNGIYLLIYPNPKDNYHYQWYKNEREIQGATNQYYYQQGGLDSGEYKVAISLDECRAFSNVFQVNNPSRIVLYPNPSREGSELVIEKDGEGKAQLVIYSVDGRLLHTQTMTDRRTTISVNLPQGVYIAHITDPLGNVKVEKIIVQ